MSGHRLRTNAGCIAFTLVLLVACASDESDDPVVPDTGEAGASGDAGDEQTPPTGAASEIRSWLDAAHYESWTCQPEPHPPGAISPHGENRVCANDLASAHGEGEYPVDTALVKEIYEGGELVGHALYRKISAGGGGESFYWFEVVNSEVNVNATGDDGSAADCVACHSLAGSDDAHPGHDFVYTQLD